MQSNAPPRGTTGRYALCAMSILLLGLNSAQAQSSVLSTSLAGPGSVLLNTTSFKYPALTPLYSYPVGFPLITCNASSGNPTQALNVSLGSSLVPATRADATSPYPAVHASIRVAWPNNVTGPSVGIDQTVFAVTEDTFLNLNTGAIAQLNNTQYITFNRSLDGTPAINYYGVGSSQTLLYVSPASFYSGGAGLDYLQIAPPAVSIPSNATSNSTRPVYLTTTQAWTKAVERLYYYTELVSLQAAVTTPCSNDSSGFYQLAPLANYLQTSVLPSNTSYSTKSVTILDNITLPDSISFQPAFTTTNLTVNSSNPHFTDLVYNTSFLPVNTVLQTFNTSNTSSANGAAICLTACRRYTPAQPQYQPRCNTWNWCNATSCTYAVNATANLTLTGQTCLLGYSQAAALNQPLGAVNTNNSGYYSGRNTAVKPYNLTGSFATINVTSTVYGNVPATPPSPAPAPAPAPARAPAVAPAPAPAPSPSSDLPCPCALPSGYNASAPDLAAMFKASANCPLDTSAGTECPQGNYGFNNTGGCNNVGCNNHGTGNVGYNNDGSNNKGDNNDGSNNVGFCLSGSGLTGNQC